jgi:hypothetical protein
MRNPFRTTLHVGIGEREITLFDERGGKAAPAFYQAAWRCQEPGAAGECQQLLTQLFKDADVRGGRVRVVLADALVRYFTVTPPANVSDLRDCEAAAALRFESLFDETPGQWLIRADWHPTQSFLACAVPRLLKASVEEAASAALLTQMGMLPHFLSVWNQWRHRVVPDGWLVLAHGAQLSLGIASRQRLDSVKRLASSTALDGRLDRLPDLLRREALFLGREMPAQVSIIAPLMPQWQRDGVEGTHFARIEPDTSFLMAVPQALREAAALTLIGGRI